jgi:DNA-binding response OmpR family regulator
VVARVLVAEDDVKQANLVRLYLERDGHSVQVVHDGRSALERCRAHRPDLVVLDVMLPGMDGFDVCRVLRTESDVPVLLLTARSREEDLLLGLDLGADDYVVKPFSPRELAARVRALLRRSGAAEPDDGGVLVHGDLRVDGRRFEVRAGDREVALTAKEFAILQLLASDPARVFTRDQIVDRVFGFDQHVQARTVDAHVMQIRRKLGDDPAAPRYVETVYGRGYRLVRAR